MGSILRYTTPSGDARFMARWRDLNGRQRSKSFHRRTDARRHVEAVETDKLRGAYFDETPGGVTFRDFVRDTYLPTRNWRRATHDLADTHFRRWILPVVGDKALRDIRPADLDRIAARCRKDGLAESTIEVVYNRAAAGLKVAEANGLIRSAPVATQRPRAPKRRPEEEVVPLTREQVAELVDNVPGRLEGFVWVMAAGGLRPGEAAGLCEDRVNFAELEIRVDQQLTTPNRGEPRLAPTKTESSRRTIPIGERLAEKLTHHLDTHGTITGDRLLFWSSGGRPLRRSVLADNWQRYRPSGTDARGWHCLRHSYASALIEAGESVKVVQARLGHATADETLNTYAHLWPGSDDNTRSAIDHWMR